jgi:hypothetical protein
MNYTQAPAAGMEERCVAIQRELRRDRLGRRELSGFERDLEWLLDELALRWRNLAAELGPTPEVRLAQAALRALEESVRWARSFRKHAPLRERRERIERGLEGAAGAALLLRRVESLRSGPQFAEGGEG